MRTLYGFGVLLLFSIRFVQADPISLTNSSLLVLQTGFPSGSIEQFSRTGTVGPNLALPVLGDIPESITVLNGQVFVGDGSGRISRIDPFSGAAATVVNTPGIALNSLGNYRGDLLALNAFGLPPSFPANTVDVYTPTGTLLNAIALQSVPSGVNWNGITSDDTTIYVSDFASGRLYKFSSTGSALGFLDTGLGRGLQGASYDASNNSIWVGNSTTNQIYDFSTDGTLLSSFASNVRPSGVAVVSSITPEPSSFLLFFPGFLALILAIRRRVRLHARS